MSEECQDIIVETYWATGEKARHEIKVRPIPGQVFPTTLNVACSKSMRHRPTRVTISSLGTTNR
jgi:hypothetical protein